jgi:putative ABC transport system permease protein
MTVYRLLALRYALHRWDRAALVVASIALGVAALVSARALNQCLETASRDTTSPLAIADLYVTNGEALVPHRLAEKLRAAAVPGVKAVQPVVYDRVSLPQLGDRVAVLIGVEISSQLLEPDNALKVTVKPTADAPIWQLLPVWKAVQDGNFSAVPALWERVPGKLVMVTKPIYDEWKKTAGPGRPLLLKHAGREVECLPVGTVEFAPDSPLAGLGAHFVGMEVGQAAGVLRPTPPFAAALGGPAAVGAAADWEALFPKKVNRLDVFLEPGADRAAVAAEVGRVVENPGAVRTPDAQRRATQEIISGIQIGFLVCSAGAMIVGLFLVYNAMAVTVAERRADIGVLRSVGATRTQVVLLFAAAAAVLGVAGSALGIPLGVAMAEVALGQAAGELSAMFLNPEVDATRVTADTALLALLAGVGTAVFAALVPAVQAAADDPARVARRTSAGAKGIWRRVHQLTCLALVAGGLAGVVFRHDLPPRVGSVGGMLVALVGLLLSAPVVVGVLAGLCRPVVRATCGVTVRLAFDNLTRAPGRTGVVVGALGAGVALMVQTAGVGRSNEEPVVEWIAQVVQADHFVFSGTMTSANSSNSPMSAGVARDLRALPGVDRVMTVRYARPEFNDTIVYLVAVDAVDYARATRARAPEGLPDLEKFLALPGTDDVLVSDNFALRHGVGVGDTIHLPGPTGPVALRVTGTVRDYSWSRGSVFMDRARYAQLFGDDLVDICHVFLKPGSSSKPVEEFAGRYGLFATDRAALRKFLSELIGRVYLLAYIQQIVVGAVAALGVVTALLISVLQRKRELGLLLAVGATPGQVMGTVLAEAVLMGVFGTALGLLIGLPMEWYVVRVVLAEETGFVLDVVVPWREAFAIAGGAILTATLAGLLPAWHAVRTRIPDAIQWE